MTIANGSANGIPPSITLYTNHGCPYAHRAHIALKELDLPYEEVIIDLETPREPWYLKINPRGLVPSIKYSNGALNDEILTESAIVAQFLADARPSHLTPASFSSPTAPLERARMSFFADTYATKVSPLLMATAYAATLPEKETKGQELVAAITKEIEPLLANAAPFFGGAAEFTMAEVLTAPFVVRMWTSCDDELIPKSVRTSLEALPNFGKWAAAVSARESVNYTFDSDKVLQSTKKRMDRMRAKAKA